MARRGLPRDWRCPKCGRRKEPTWHHVCPGSRFINVPLLPICRECHNGIEMIINERMKANKNRPLPIREYFLIWQEFTGENIDGLYDMWKNKIKKRDKPRKRNRKKH